MTYVNKILIIINKFLFELYVGESLSLLHHKTLFLLFWLTPKEKEPEDEQGYYVSSLHLKNYSANPLDTLHIKK